ncbi:thiol reductase thioredoxin [Streptosporangium jomthongense]|uniref:Thioredoxin family protein n=1 Tax=Marinobacter aromaticivorans TaxID=1494078 RepID=A0ABW2IQY6_9GAMM|nr:thioredoxin family protein [Marinobacter aromaticivorans]GGE55638.1 thiol reductase thioredoxin [Streptosporangium jomthongense]
MRVVDSEEALAELVGRSAAALVLYGGESCGVCQAVKPQLERMVRDEYPALVMAYVDCQASAPLCARRGIFTLPVIHLWFQGQRFAEFARVFSIGDVRAALERPYALAMQQDVTEQ